MNMKKSTTRIALPAYLTPNAARRGFVAFLFTKKPMVNKGDQHELKRAKDEF